MCSTFTALKLYAPPNCFPLNLKLFERSRMLQVLTKQGYPQLYPGDFREINK